jgi:hypothetical protein
VWQLTIEKTNASDREQCNKQYTRKQNQATLDAELQSTKLDQDSPFQSFMSNLKEQALFSD